MLCCVSADKEVLKPEVTIDPRVAMEALKSSGARGESGAGASSSAAGPSATANPTAASGSAANSQLWVEKHKPRDSRELVGNQATIEWLRVFLRNWCAALLPLLTTCSLSYASVLLTCSSMQYA